MAAETKEIESFIMKEADHVREVEPPTIDLKGDKEAVVLAIQKACEQWGFFQVTNHGIGDELIANVEKVTKNFFSLSTEEKKLVKRKDDNPRGFFDDEFTKQTKDLKEGFDVGGEGKFEVDGENQWPEQPSDFKVHVQNYYRAVENLSFYLAGLIALSLGLEENAFENDLKGNTSFMRLNKYPVCDNKTKAVGEDWNPDTEPDPERDGVLSINKHTDAGVLTVLRQREGDPASLQVLNRRVNRFVRVNPTPGAFIINVGDMLQVWSSDRYLSPVHRVLANQTSVRFSFPFFLNPNYSSVCVGRVSDRANVYRPFEWREFRRKRFEGDFANYGKADVQISDYKLVARHAKL